ncbi:MAG: hypothetical protein JO263_03920 [Candidatus Eremiobacteraeota bacterium]|nr:hypothetical protein [Candidatus Eremiobacteraeota bacterium]
MRDLGSLVRGAHKTFPNGISDRGFVVGQSCANSCAAFYWNGRLHRIPSADAGNATDVNDNGAIVGDGFVFVNHNVIALQSPSRGELDEGRINNDGIVVATNFGSTNGAYIATPQQKYVAQLIAGITYSDAYGITDRGDVLLQGSVNGSSGYFVLKSGKFITVASADSRFTGKAIDNNDDVAGFVLVDPSTVFCDAAVYRFSTRAVVKLGPLSDTYPSTRAFAINDDGAVVGGAGAKGSFNEVQHAFYWEPTLGMVDLNDAVPPSHYDLTMATGINNRGQIIVIGILPGESEGIDGHALLLTPASRRS